MKKTTKKILIILIAAVLVVLLAIVAILLFERCNPTPPTPGFTPDYPAPPVDDGAGDIGGGDEGKLEAPSEGGSAVGLIYSIDVKIDLSEEKVTLYFGNPKRSLQNMFLQLVIQDQVVAESGLLLPGKQISELALKEGFKDTLPIGYYTTNTKFLIRYYDPETNQCALVNTEILVNVTVTE